jgi:hypothetical protein
MANLAIYKQERVVNTELRQETPKRKDNLENLYVENRIILKHTFQK